PGLGHGVRIAGPAGRHRLVPRLAEPLHPGSPGVGVQPEAVDEHNRDTWGSHRPIPPEVAPAGEPAAGATDPIILPPPPGPPHRPAPNPSFGWPTPPVTGPVPCRGRPRTAATSRRGRRRSVHRLARSGRGTTTQLLFGPAGRAVRRAGGSPGVRPGSGRTRHRGSPGTRAAASRSAGLPGPSRRPAPPTPAPVAPAGRPARLAPGSPGRPGGRRAGCGRRPDPPWPDQPRSDPPRPALPRYVRGRVRRDQADRAGQSDPPRPDLPRYVRGRVRRDQAVRAGRSDPP